MMILDALLIITSTSLCTVSDGSQDGDGMSNAAAAPWLELQETGRRQVRPAPWVDHKWKSEWVWALWRLTECYLQTSTFSEIAWSILY